MKRKLISIVLILFITISAFSQQDTTLANLSLEELMQIEVSVASKKQEKQSDAPGIITVITNEELKGFAAKNLGEIMNRLVGTVFLSPDVFLNQAISMRAQAITPYDNHVLILMNGRPVRDPLTGGLNSPMYLAYPVEAIEQIEIIRGPGSVIYGSCAFSGVINIITKKQTDDGITADASLDAGSFEYFGQTGNLYAKKGDFNAGVNIKHTSMTGPEYQFSDYNLKDSVANFYTNTFAAVANLSFKNFTFNGLISKSEPFSLNGDESWDKTSVEHQMAVFGDIGYKKDFSEKFSVAANVTYNHHIWFDNEMYGNTTGSSIMPELNFRYMPIENLNFLLGAGYENNDWPTSRRLIGNNVNSGFVYAQADYTYKILKFIAGFQANKIEKVNVNISPRVGLIANITDKFGGKLLYSQAFRRGYPNETSFAVLVFRGNPLLEPELIDTYEAQLFYNTAKYQVALTYYNSTMSNLITRNYYDDPTSTPPFFLKYENGGDWNFQGVELEGKFVLCDNWLITGSASYQTNKKGDVENASLHPDLMVKGGIMYRHERFSVGIFNSYFGKPYSTTTIRPDSKQVNKEPEAFNLLSAKIDAEMVKIKNATIRLFVTGDNLLNTEITYPDYPNKKLNSLIPLHKGISFRAGLSVNF